MSTFYVKLSTQLPNERFKYSSLRNLTLCLWLVNRWGLSKNILQRLYLNMYTGLMAEILYFLARKFWKLLFKSNVLMAFYPLIILNLLINNLWCKPSCAHYTFRKTLGYFATTEKDRSWNYMCVCSPVTIDSKLLQLKYRIETKNHQFL